MTTILEHVLVICMGMLLPRRSYEQSIFGLLYLMAASSPFKNSMLAKPIIIRYWPHPTPLHPMVLVGPFVKWGIDFMTCHPHSARGHGYIIFRCRLVHEMGRGDADI
jgi:hypothetical protein